MDGVQRILAQYLWELFYIVKLRMRRLTDFGETPFESDLEARPVLTGVDEAPSEVSLETPPLVEGAMTATRTNDS